MGDVRREEADAIVDRFADWLFDNNVPTEGRYAGWEGLRLAIADAIAEGKRSVLRDVATEVESGTDTGLETSDYGKGFRRGLIAGAAVIRGFILERT